LSQPDAADLMRREWQITFRTATDIGENVRRRKEFPSQTRVAFD